MSKKPDWYDESKLDRAYYAIGYTGWIINLGDGTCRYANNPLLGEGGPKWGDRVRLIDQGDDCLPLADSSQIIERYGSE